MRAERILSIVFVAASILACTPSVKTTFVLDPPEAVLNPGKTLRLFVKSGTRLSSDAVTWSTLDPSVATVDDYGTVTAVALGETVVTASAAGTSAASRIKVTPVEVQSLTLNYRQYTASPDDLVQLVATVEPAEAEVQIQWESSNPAVVTVDRNGLVTAVDFGSATVTAKAAGLEASCAFTVAKTADLYDIFYADGSFSSELDPAKEIRGFVFWKGNPTEFDPALKADHPECSHGLAVSFREIYQASSGSYTLYWIDYDNDEGLVYYGNGGGKAWQEVAGSVADWALVNCPGLNPVAAASLGDEASNIYLNTPQGYNNTKAIKAYNKAHGSTAVIPVSLLDEYEKTYPLPANTSGYYLPSAKEASLLWGGAYNDNVFGGGAGDAVKRGINNLVRTINESGAVNEETMAYPLGDSYYWTSTEDENSSMAYYISGMVMGAQKSSQYLVRYIFAF